MGRKRLPVGDRREVFTIRLPVWVIQKIKENEDFRKKIEEMIVNELKHGKN